MAVVVGHDLPEALVALEQPIQRLQLAYVFRREWPPLALVDKSSKPFAQASRLTRDVIELSRHRPCPQRFKRFTWDELRLLQPGQETVAVGDPVELRVHRGRNRIEEIQAERVGDEHGGRAVGSRLGDLSVLSLGHLRVPVIFPSQSNLSE